MHLYPRQGDGSPYLGQVNGIHAHGVGRYFPTNENLMYLGEFNQGMPNGYGMLMYADDSIYMLYQGQWENGAIKG